MRRKALTSFVLAVSLGTFAMSCGDGGRSERSLGGGGSADQEFTDFVTMESDSGVVQWKLEAPVARVYNVRNLLVTDQPVISFFDETGKVSSVLTAEKAEYNKITHDLTALGNVVVTSSEGYVLETESLIWLNKVEQIYTEDFVKVTRGNDILTGYGFQGYPELKNIDIKKDVKAYLKDEEGAVGDEIDRETQRETSDDAGTVEEPVKETGTDSVEEPVKETGTDSVEEPVKESGMEQNTDER